MNTQNQGKPQEVKIVDNLPGAEYTNAMQVNHNRDEFQIIFLNILGATGRVAGKIITGPGHLKRIVKALNENLKKYEDKFGEIKEVESPEKNEIGFNVK